MLIFVNVLAWISPHAGNTQSDPFFLYQLEVTEADFQLLKREQALHVDFAAFPQNVLELLDLCAAPKSSEGAAPK